MAAAGVDASNVEPGHVVLLPERPRRLGPGAARRRSRERTGAQRRRCVVTDTAGPRLARGADRHRRRRRRAAGARRPSPAAPTRYGNELAVTAPAVADEIAGAAELAQGKLGRPAVRGRPRPGRPGAAGRRRRPRRRGPGPRPRARTCSGSAPGRPCWRALGGRPGRPRGVRRAGAGRRARRRAARRLLGGSVVDRVTATRCSVTADDRRAPWVGRGGRVRPRLARSSPAATRRGPCRVRPSLRRLCRAHVRRSPHPPRKQQRKRPVAKSAKTDRQAVVEQMRAKQKSAERRRGIDRSSASAS